jgi:hypothetical protein
MSSEKQRIRQKIENLVKDIIQQSIYYDWFHRTANPRVTTNLSNAFGMTDAVTLRAHIQMDLFVKFHPDNVLREESGYKLLYESSDEFARHLVPSFPLPTEPKVLWLTPFVNAKTLHEFAYKTGKAEPFEQWIKKTHDDVLSKMQELWERTKTPTPPNVEELYIERIWKRAPLLEEKLRSHHLQNISIKVNEKEYGSLESIMDKFIEQINRTKPLYSCTTHSDEHAKNILIYEDAERRRSAEGWLIIDYAGARKQSDWILSIAKMLQWWDYYCVLEEAKSDFKIKRALEVSPCRPKNGQLVLSYNEDALKELIPVRCQDFSKRVYSFAQEVGIKFGEGEQTWKQRLELALFSIIFASAPLHFEKADFIVPIMIGEALKHFSAAFKE